MSICTYAKKLESKTDGFSPETRRIVSPAAEKGVWFRYKKSFSLESIPDRATFKISSAGYADFSFNGVLAGRFAVRSLCYDIAFEAYDILPFLKLGENTVTINSFENGHDSLRGTVCEAELVFGDKTEIICSDGSWLCARDERFTPGAGFFLEGSSFALFDARIPEPEESDYLPVTDCGGAYSAPYEKKHQSSAPCQTETLRCPASVIDSGNFNDAPGYRFKLGESGKFAQLFMTVLSCGEDFSLSVLSTRSVGLVGIDGERIEQRRDYRLCAGKHTLSFYSPGYFNQPEILLVTEAALTLDSGLSGKGEWLVYKVQKTNTVKYPFNENEASFPIPPQVGVFLAAKAPADLPADIFENSTPAESSPLKDIHFIKTKQFFPGKSVATVTDDGASLKVGKGKTRVVLDFGCETIGFLSFEIDAKSGDSLQYFGFEQFDKNGPQFMGDQSFFEYKYADGCKVFVSPARRGFRYLAIDFDCKSDYIHMYNICVNELRQGFSENCGFECSDDALNKVYEMSCRTTELCMLDSYVDCPGHEQNIWVGDALVIGAINLLNFGNYRFDDEYLRLISHTIDPEMAQTYRRGNPRYAAGKYLPCACFPTYPEGNTPIWSFAWVEHVLLDYTLTGDKERLKELFPAVVETFRRAELLTNSRGLLCIDGAWNLIEWANNDICMYGEAVAGNAMLSGCLRLASKYAFDAGFPELTESLLASANRYRDAINRYAWSESRSAYVDTVRDEYAYKDYLSFMQSIGRTPLDYDAYLSQERISVQTNTFVYLYDCAPPERSFTLKYLIENAESGDYVAGSPAQRSVGKPSEEEAPGGIVKIGSPFFLFFALRALYKAGESGLAERVMRRDWSRMLQRGINTCTEAFISDKKSVRSIAHAWSASPAIYLKNEVLGINPLEPGYKTFEVNPRCDGDISWARGAVPTPCGEIRVSWTREGDGIKIECSAPAECKRIK